METIDLLKQLEINYKSISNDLEFASHQIDAGMTSAARIDSSLPDLHALQSRIRALQGAMPGLAADSTEVVRQRKKTEPAFNAAVLENYEVMVGLYARLGVAPDPEWVAVARDIESLVPEAREAAAGGGNMESDMLEGRILHGGAVDSKGGIEAGATRGEENRRKPSPESIFEEDFMAVSANTRGRSRLQDVRKVYAKVREDYEDKRNRGRPGCRPDPITKKELDAAGLKVFGLTGDSILNTLRAMGLITVSKGSVTIP